MRLGIDVSAWQHPGKAPIDWTKVRSAGVDWCAVKLTEGTFYKNPYARDDVLGAQAVGIEVVGYHFARPMQSSANAQARYVHEWLADNNVRVPIALDVEDGRQMGWDQLAVWCHEFIASAEAGFIYYNRSYREAMKPTGLWLRAAEWLAAPGALRVGELVEVHQHSQGPIPGIVGLVDVNAVGYKRTDKPTARPAKPKSGRPVDPETAPVLHRNSRGETVTILQDVLRRVGMGVPVDGVFGPITENAVRAFQRSHDIAADGIVGRLTWARLMAQLGY